VLPHGEDALGRAEVDRARRVEGEADFKNGHMALDWRRTASMAVEGQWVWAGCRGVSGEGLGNGKFFSSVLWPLLKKRRVGSAGGGQRRS
jgi:hypothetical protein